jgi:hypothetical protein
MVASGRFMVDRSNSDFGWALFGSSLHFNLARATLRAATKSKNPCHKSRLPSSLSAKGDFHVPHPLLVNGFFMLLTPNQWYFAVPGVTETGPLNPHFIRDIGLGFLSAGAALVLAARLPTIARPLILVASIFLLGHALLHVIEMIVHGSEAGPALRDIALIVVPAALPLLFVRKGAASC